MIRQLNQYLVFDRGGTKVTIFWSTARDPLKNEKYQPYKVISWVTPTCDYWLAYFVLQGVEIMSDEALKSMVENGITRLV